MAAFDAKLLMDVASEEDILDSIHRMAQNHVEQFALVLVAGRPLSVPSQVGTITLNEFQPFVFQLEQE